MYVSQNSSWAVVCNNFFALLGSLTPGNSTRILAVLLIRWILGCVTPKRSILLLKILNELEIASSTSSFNTAITAWLVAVDLIFSFNWVLNKIAIPFDGDFFSYSSPNKVKKPFLFWALLSLMSVADSIAELKSASVLLFDNSFSKSLTSTSKVTFIPPWRSRPKLISLCLHSK